MPQCIAENSITTFITVLLSTYILLRYAHISQKFSFFLSFFLVLLVYVQGLFKFICCTWFPLFRTASFCWFAQTNSQYMHFYDLILIEKLYWSYHICCTLIECFSFTMCERKWDFWVNYPWFVLGLGSMLSLYNISVNIFFYKWCGTWEMRYIKGFRITCKI